MESNSTEPTEHDKIISILKEKYDGEILHVDTPYNLLTVTLKQDRIIEIIQHLYDHAHVKFQYLTTLCAVHYPDLKQIAIVYQLRSLENNLDLRLKIYLPEENPVTPTLTSIFAAANWMERETYDFYGVNFQGHPSLRRILNVDDMVIFPMRKEYPLEDQTREDKNNAMFGR